MPHDRVTVRFPGQDADCEIEPTAGGYVRLTLRVEATRITADLIGADAMQLGHELRMAATHAAHLRIAAAKEASR